MKLFNLWRARKTVPSLLLSTVVTLSLLFLTGGCAADEAGPGNQSGNQARPNILLIMPDDLGWSDVGYYGSSVKTPNIDELARSGIRLDQHYVMPTCTPTRVGFLTGKYPSRYGVTGPDYGEVIDRGDPTLASLLQEENYHTSIAGKWHMGSPPHTPLKYGFDSSYGYFDGQIDPYTHYYKADRELTSRETWHRNDEYLDEEGHVTDLITEEAVRVIEENRENPFFLYVAYSVPHFPLDEPDKWTSMYENTVMHESRRWFAASVTHMDDGIGQIIDALDRTGQREHTLVVFVSDNGGQHRWHSETEYRGRYADKPHTVLGNNFPLRGWKGDLYEGGIRVPGLVNWPGRLEPGSLDLPIQIEDWLPTFYELAGGDRDLESMGLDGRNVWPLLAGERDEIEDRSLYWKTGSALAVREGPWKLLVHRDNGDTELYNLEEDFRETNDRSEDMPQKVRDLEVLLEEFEADDR